MTAFIVGAAVLALGVWAVVHSLRTVGHLPAAPDNQPGRNTDDLIVCRRILRATREARKENPQP